MSAGDPEEKSRFDAVTQDQEEVGGHVRTISVRIEGTSPLLQHRFYSADEPDKKVTVKTGRPSYEDEAEKAAYRDAEGSLYQPADHIMASMTKAAANFKIPGRRGKSFRDLFQTAVLVVPDCIQHENQDFTVDVRGVVVQRNRVLRHRPRLDKWALEFEIQVLDEQLSLDVVRQVLDYAGQSVGIGDYRPKYGRFSVTSWKVEK